MTVTPKKFNIPLGLGIDTKTDAKSLPAGKLEVLENGIFTNKPSIKKRNGYVALTKDVSGESDLTIAKDITTRNDELVLLNGNDIFSYSGGVEEWTNKGALFSLGQTQRTVAATPAEQVGADCAESGGITCYAWVDSTGVRATIEDTESGNLIVHNLLVSAIGSRPRLVGFQGYVHILYVDTASNSLKNKRISAADTTTSVTTAAVTVINDIDSTNPNYDVKLNGSHAVFTYHSVAGTLKVGFIATNGEAGSPGNGNFPSVTEFASAVPDGCLSITSAGTNIYVAFVESTVTINMYSLYTSGFNILRLGTGDDDLAENSTDYTATNITAVYTDTVGDDSQTNDIHVYFEVPNANSWNYYTRCKAVSVPATLGTGLNKSLLFTWRHMGLGSHSFVDSGDNASFVNLVHDSVEQNSYFTVRSDGFILGRHLAGLAGGLVSNSNLPSVYAIGRVHSMANIFKNRREVDLGADAAFSEKGIKRVDLDFDSAQAYRSSQLGNTTYITGGFLTSYDGYFPIEAGYHLYPENVTAIPVNGAGALTSSTTYSYQVHWEWFTAQGERELSTAVPISVVMGVSDDTVVLTIPTLSMTAKKAPERAEVRLAVTRTLANSTTRYRVDDPISPTYNDTTVDTIIFTDLLADSVIDDRELDYTNAEFEHVSPPSAEIITGTKDRIFLSGFDNPYVVRYSKLHVWGDVVSFNGAFQVQVDQKGGSITAISPLDDKLIVFKENRIFAFNGDGPSNTGLGNGGFSPPQLITSNVGCTNQRSIVDTPEGVMFQSSKGIYLLDRGMKVSYIGADVEAFNNQTITSAELIPDKDLVIFLCQSGKTLVYDYYFKQWSTYTGHAGVGAVIWKGVYVYSKNTGLVFKETENHYKDNTSRIKLAIETGWIAFDGLQGYARVRRLLGLGEYKSAHTLRTKLAYNYNPYFSHTIDWTPDTVLEIGTFGVSTCIGEVGGLFGVGEGTFGGAKSSVYQFEVQMPNQKVQAIKFRFEDITGNTHGESFVLNNLVLEVGLETIPWRVDVDKIVG